MPSGGRDGQGLEPLAEHFLGLVAEGRGDLARGRHLYLLRALDALWDPAALIDLPYRPVRNPGAFIAMTFDLVGDARFGYSLALDASAAATHDVRDRLRAHLRARLQAPWQHLVADARLVGVPHLAAMLAAFVPDVLERSPLSRLADELARRTARMTTAQAHAFDRVAFVARLSVAQVLELVGWRASAAANGTREQHPTGGDLRALLRRRLDGPWATALRELQPTDALDVVASMPVPVEQLAGLCDAGDFAVSYALATDARSPGRRWDAPSPFVSDAGRDTFEFFSGRAEGAGSVGRAERLAHWGASLVYPTAYALVDAALQRAAGLEPFHAGGSWRGAVSAWADAVARRRRAFTGRVAAHMAGAATAGGVERVPEGRAGDGQEALA